MNDLITLDELRDRLGIDQTDTRDDVRYQSLIPAASLAILNYTGRDFGSDSVTETRSFEYDGSGFLDIDDAEAITKVEFVVPHAANIELDADTWYAAPARRDDSPVFYYLVLTTPQGINPYMGFERNLDVLYAEGRLPSVTRTAQVTGTWGWPEVPEDVKVALTWTVEDWANKPSNESLTAEAIEGFSRGWGNKAAQVASLAIPNRARDLLASYDKTVL